MSKEKIYNIMHRLGMVDDDNRAVCELLNPDRRDKATRFAEDTCTDLVELFNFVTDICLNNDLNTIEKFLVCLLHEEKK